MRAYVRGVRKELLSAVLADDPETIFGVRPAQPLVPRIHHGRGLKMTTSRASNGLTKNAGHASIVGTSAQAVNLSAGPVFGNVTRGLAVQGLVRREQVCVERAVERDFPHLLDHE
jgi:hypothetical protein